MGAKPADLQVRQKLTEAKRDKEALLVARRKLDELMSELKAKLHVNHPSQALNAALSKLDSQITAREVLIKRIETVGR